MGVLPMSGEIGGSLNLAIIKIIIVLIHYILLYLAIHYSLDFTDKLEKSDRKGNCSDQEFHKLMLLIIVNDLLI